MRKQRFDRRTELIFTSSLPPRTILRLRCASVKLPKQSPAGHRDHSVNDDVFEINGIAPSWQTLKALPVR
jgi:hypothetical protein